MNETDATKTLPCLRSKVVSLLRDAGIENGHQLMSFTTKKLGFGNGMTRHPAYETMDGKLPSIATATKLMLAFGIGLDDIYELNGEL